MYACALNVGTLPSLQAWHAAVTRMVRCKDPDLCFVQEFPRKNGTQGWSGVPCITLHSCSVGNDWTSGRSKRFLVDIHVCCVFWLGEYNTFHDSLSLTIGKSNQMMIVSVLMSTA